MSVLACLPSFETLFSTALKQTTPYQAGNMSVCSQSFLFTFLSSTRSFPELPRGNKKGWFQLNNQNDQRGHCYPCRTCVCLSITSCCIHNWCFIEFKSKISQHTVYMAMRVRQTHTDRKTELWGRKWRRKRERERQYYVIEKTQICAFIMCPWGKYLISWANVPHL